MNDNDCVSRKAILSKVTYFEHDNLLAVCVRDINETPAVPHEMTAREYLMVRTRMCYKYEACEGCPLNIINEKYNCLCFEVESQSPEEAVAVVEAWAHEHPEERSENDEQDN